jgi:sec-independent protein translocase protein TatA
MFGLGMSELVVVMIIVLLVFGGSKISGVGRSLGEAISEFKEALKPEEKIEKKESSTDSEKSE